MESILDIVNNNKDDKTLYNIIFNILSKNTDKYTTNKNGVWFNLKHVSKEAIHNSVIEANNYLKIKLNNEKLEVERNKMMSEMNQLVNGSYKSDLKKIICNNKILSSSISSKTESMSTVKRPSIIPVKNPVKAKLPAVYLRLSKIIKTRKNPELYDEEYDADKKQVKKEYQITSLSQITKKKKNYSSRIINTKYLNKSPIHVDELSNVILNLEIHDEDNMDICNEAHNDEVHNDDENDDEVHNDDEEDELHNDDENDDEVHNDDENDSLFGYESE